LYNESTLKKKVYQQFKVKEIMMTTNSIQKASRRSLGLTYKDGLFDILLGSFFVLLAVQVPLEQRGFQVWVSYLPALLTMGIGLPVYYWVKKKIVAPRIGIARISLRKNAPRRSIFLIALALQLITLVIFILTVNGWLGEVLTAKTGWVIDAFFAVAIFGVFAFIGYLVDAPRFYLYGLLLGMGPLLAILVDTDELVSHIPTLLTGVAMVIGGALALTRFLKEFPVVEAEVGNEQPR
jgi:hypothetical protein